VLSFSSLRLFSPAVEHKVKQVFFILGGAKNGLLSSVSQKDFRYFTSDTFFSASLWESVYMLALLQKNYC